MTLERPSEDDAALDAAFAELAEPELPAELARRLRAIPGQKSVRRFPGRSWRASAFGWAAAAALGLFIGAQSADPESDEAASLDGASVVAEASEDEDETLALAIGSFSELEEEP